MDIVDVKIPADSDEKDFLGFIHKYTRNITLYASIHGNIHVLNWLWKKHVEFTRGLASGIEFKTDRGLDLAIENNQINVVMWFYDRHIDFLHNGVGIEFIYDNGSLLKAFEEGHIDLVNWVLKRSLS
jgi:hypothetical protein